MTVAEYQQGLLREDILSVSYHTQSHRSVTRCFPESHPGRIVGEKLAL